MKYTSNILEYSEGLFVNREWEIRVVLDKAASMARGKAIRVRTIVFWGYRGTGRTWLLREITRQLDEMAGVRPVYVDLSMYADQSVEEALRALVVQVSEVLWTPDSAQASLYRRAVDVSLATITAWLASDIQTWLQQKILVLLLDHVYESDWSLLAGLEDRFLAPLVAQPRVLLVMAGRGWRYPWKTPELRLYVEEQDLEPFDEDMTKQQLEKQKPDAVPRTAEIYEISQGYPLGNYLLAARPAVAEAMQETVDDLLDAVPAEERSWLEALCVLQAFDGERIPVLLAAYSNDPAILKWPYPQVRQVRERLLRTALIRWKESDAAWVIDEAIRPVLERYLQEAKLELWRRLHCAALRLYQDWEQRHPSGWERWRQEASHHAKCLLDAGHDPERCP